MTNYTKQVRLFMFYDILGDMERTGPKLWYIKRKMLENIKNHCMDLMLMIRLFKSIWPDILDYEKMEDYAMFHDLPEAITGDITKFQGISGDEKKRVTYIALDYIDRSFGDIINLRDIIKGFEEKVDLEAKVVSLLDSIHSATTFLKYQCEQDIDMDNPSIIRLLREHPFIVDMKRKGKDLGDIFYEFYLKVLVISDEECERFGITREVADSIITILKGFFDEFYKQKLDDSLLPRFEDFPAEAVIYR